MGLVSGIKVYRYGLLAPTENAHLVGEQMWLAHRYQNTLIEIERARRAALRAVYVAHGDVAAMTAVCQAATAEVARLYRDAKAARSQSRKRQIPSEIGDALKVAKEASREAQARLRAARLAIKTDPSVVASREQIEERAAWLRRNARAYCGVYWGTYLGIESAVSQTAKMPLYDGSEPNDPRFSRWEHEGTVGVQLQGGLAGAGAMRCDDTRLRIEVGTAPKGVDPTSRRSATRRYMVLAMRVDSDGRDPVWARWPMKMHRPLPDDAVIKWAHVHRRRRGPHDEWSVTLTIETSAARPAAPTGAVGIDLGWRSLDTDGIRVAAWHGSDGRSGTLVLSEWDLSRLEKANDLRSIRDKKFDAARAALSTWLENACVPAWFHEATAHLVQWKSIERLMGLVRRWKGSRFGGDDAAYEALEAWRYNDHHLWAWEAHQRVRALRNRREIYRVFAARMAREYHTVVLEDWNISKIAKRPAVDEETVADGNKNSRTARQSVAVSELRLALTHAFGARVEKVPCAFTTRDCHACGSVESWDQAAELVHTCSSCGVVWDQDANAAQNLLARFAARGGGDLDNAGTARGNETMNASETLKESRWARAKRVKAERIASDQVARE
jgi:transposase